MLQGVDRQFAAHRQALERCCLPPRLWRAANVARRLFTPPLRSYRRRMSPLLGTSPTLGDVRPESEKRSKADIEQTSPNDRV
jgi:hypothetical protein